MSNQFHRSSAQQPIISTQIIFDLANLLIWRIKYLQMIDQKDEISHCYLQQGQYNTIQKIQQNGSAQQKSSTHKKKPNKCGSQWRGVIFSQKLINKESVKTLNLAISEDQGFKKNWEKLQAQTNAHIRYVMMIPEACSMEGQMMLRDGSFLVWWLKTLQTSEFINIKAVSNIAYQKFCAKLSINKQIFLDYYQRLSNLRIEYQMEQEPMEIQGQGLKRAIKYTHEKWGNNRQIEEQEQSLVEKNSAGTTQSLNFQFSGSKFNMNNI